MIIIKTKEGDCFINDHEMQLIDHYHKIKTVYIRSKDGKVKDEITHVESVRYISDTKAIDYTDEGSEVQKLKKENKEMKELIRKYRILKEEIHNMVDNLEYISNLEIVNAESIRNMVMKEITGFMDNMVKLLQCTATNENREGSH